MSGNDFSDVEDQLSRTRGVLDGEAFGEVERIKEKANPKERTVDFTCTCQHCSVPICVQIPVYEELIPASLGVAPRDAHTGAPWTAYNGALFPPINCKCGQFVQIPITPDKAARHVQTMVKLGVITPQQYQAKVQEVQRLAGPRR